MIYPLCSYKRLMLVPNLTVESETVSHCSDSRWLRAFVCLNAQYTTETCNVKPVDVLTHME